MVGLLNLTSGSRDEAVAGEKPTGGEPVAGTGEPTNTPA
jgi:hypothetical protein